jgi:hypothetical protein
MRRVKVTGGTISGKYCKFAEDIGAEFFTYPTTMYSNANSPGADFYVPPVDVNSIFARANPYRPEILSLAFLAELRDLPKMIRDLGRFKLNKKPIYGYRPGQGLAKEWVSLNFGWAPLVKDLLSLTDVFLGLTDRQKEIDRLYSGSGLKRRINLGTVEGGAFFDADFPPGQIPWNIMIATGSGKCQRWAVVKYKPATDPSTGFPVHRPDIYHMRQALLGLNSVSAIASAWELLPWSWFIDYTANVGSWLASRTEGHLLTLERACLMQHFTLEATCPKQSYTDNWYNTVVLEEFKVLKETKMRTPITPGVLPTIRLPVLSGGQLSILGSLAFLRSRGLKPVM